MAIGAWSIVVYVCLALPLILLTLLLLPVPRPFHRATLKLVDRTLGLTFIGTFSLLHVMLVVSGVTFAASVQSTYHLEMNKSAHEGTPATDIWSNPRMKRTRAQRNFWISFMSLSLWLILARVYAILLHKKRLEDQVAGVSGSKPSAPPISSSGAPTKPPVGTGAAPKKAQ